jgi:hypothetical protein
LLKNRKKIIEHHNENNKNHDENRSWICEQKVIAWP